MPRRATHAIPQSRRGSRGPHGGPATLPAPGPAVGLGQQAAAQAGAPPGGAQSLALTQLNAGAAGAPFPRRLRWHSPAEVIMAAPCARVSARSLTRLRSVFVSSGTASPAAPPHCPGAQLSQSPLQAAGSLLAQDPARPGAAYRPACRPPQVLPRLASSAPIPPPWLSQKDAQRVLLFSLTFYEVRATAQWEHSSASAIRLQYGHLKKEAPSPTVTRHRRKCVEGRYERYAQRHLLPWRSLCSAHPVKPVGGGVRMGQILFSLKNDKKKKKLKQNTSSKEILTEMLSYDNESISKHCFIVN